MKLSTPFHNLIILLIFILFNSSPAQESIFFKISYIMPEGGFSDTQESIIDKLTDDLLSRGYKIGKNPKWSIFLNIYQSETSDSDKIFLSYTLSQSLPQSIIDFGVKNEVLYLALDKIEKKEDQNEEVRRYLTSEFLHQFSMIVHSNQYLIMNSDLDSQIDEIIEEIHSTISITQK